MLRVGLVGSGFMGTTHAAAWAETPAQLVGIYSETNAQALADQYGAQIFPSLDALLAAVDVVDICTPTHLHHQMVLQAAAAGKHIICEKPLARSYADGREMVAACQAAGVQLLVAHVVRFFPEYALAKATVERGEIGQVAVVRLTRCSFKPAANEPQKWFHDLAKSGGMILDLMIHDFDYARWVAGEVESVFVKSILQADPTRPADYALAFLRHHSGALSHVEGGWAYPPPLFRTALEIAGNQGLIEHPVGSSVPLEIVRHTQKTNDSPDIAVPSSPLAQSPYTTQIQHFYEVLTGATATPRVTAEDGLAALRISLAAMQSIQTGQPVYVEEIN